MAPAPIMIKMVGVIRFSPDVQYSIIFLLFPSAIEPTIPANGKINKESIFSLARKSMPIIDPIGLIINRTTAIIGVTKALDKGGRFAELAFSNSAASASVTFVPLYLINDAMATATINPKIAGTSPPIITWLTSRLNPPAAAIVFGFGEIMLPALPPPDNATSSATLEYPILLPTDSAIGATINTATGMKTPTAVIIIVAKASDSIALVPPSLSTINLAMVSAAPDSIITPAKTPAAIIRITVPCTLWVPVIKIFMTSAKLAPPINPPIIAPKINA
ncbi:hypothetical protein D3C77_362570 [compost metagenome]